MNVFNRVVVSLLAVLLIAVGVIMLLILTEAIVPEDVPGVAIQDALVRLDDTTGDDRNIAYGVAVALIVIGVVVLLAEIIPPATGPNMVVLRDGEHGQVQFSLDSLNQLAERTSLSHRQVRSADSRVRSSDEGLRVRTDVEILAGSDAQAVTSELQDLLADVMGRMTGLPVTEVDVRARYGRGRGEQPILARR